MASEMSRTGGSVSVEETIGDCPMVRCRKGSSRRMNCSRRRSKLLLWAASLPVVFLLCIVDGSSWTAAASIQLPRPKSGQLRDAKVTVGANSRLTAPATFLEHFAAAIASFSGTLGGFAALGDNLHTVVETFAEKNADDRHRKRCRPCAIVRDTRLISPVRAFVYWRLTTLGPSMGWPHLKAS